MTTREEAIALVKEAGIISQGYDVVDEDDERCWKEIERLINLAKAKENEACAKIAAKMSYYKDDGEECAEAIRARMKP